MTLTKRPLEECTMKMAYISIDANSRGGGWWRLLDLPWLSLRDNNTTVEYGCHIVCPRCNSNLSAYPTSDLDCPALGTNDYSMFMKRAGTRPHGEGDIRFVFLESLDAGFRKGNPRFGWLGRRQWYPCRGGVLG